MSHLHIYVRPGSKIPILLVFKCYTSFTVTSNWDFDVHFRFSFVFVPTTFQHWTLEIIITLHFHTLFMPQTSNLTKKIHTLERRIRVRLCKTVNRISKAIGQFISRTFIFQSYDNIKLFFTFYFLLLYYVLMYIYQLSTTYNLSINLLHHSHSHLVFVQQVFS